MDILEKTLDQIIRENPEIFKIINEFDEQIHIFNQQILTESNKIQSDQIINKDILKDNNQSSQLDFNFMQNYVDPLFSNNNNVQFGGALAYNIYKTSQRINNQFNCEEITYQLRFSESNKTFEQAIDEINQLFHELCQEFIQNLNEKDKIRISFIHPSLSPSINLPFMNKETITPQNLLAIFERVAQSKKTIKLNESNQLRVDVIIARLPAGSGRKFIPENQKFKNIKINNKSNLNYFERWCSSKACVKLVFNSDNYCALRAILIAKAYVDKDPKAFKLTLPNNARLNKLVKKYALDLNLPNKKCGIEEIAHIERSLKDYQITVINCDGKIHKEPLYIGEIKDKFIYITYSGNHFAAITTMSGFFDRGYFCHFCKKNYNNLEKHKCEYNCKHCRRYKCFETTKIACKFCKTQCKNETCVRIHQERFCFQAKKCHSCNSFKGINHVCNPNDKWCKNCKKSVDEKHRCFIKPEKIDKQLDEIKGYIYFDYEAYLDENKRHVPNLVMAMKVCLNCSNKNNLECDECKIQYKFIDNIAFCEWLFNQENYIAIAHNLKGYDGVFIVNYIISAFLPIDALPNILITGTKILAIRFRKIKIIDSYSFLPFALSEFSNTFNLKETKGFFPHKFNHPNNYNYVGTFPSPEYYGSEFFGVKKKIEFDKWYDTVKNQIFNFKEQFESYCWSDVVLLAEGCMAFNEIIKNKTKLNKNDTGVEAFRCSITIASLCHYIFRRNMMKPESIGVIPENGYHPEQKTSIKCQLWLKYLSNKHNIQIQHAKNSGEISVGKYLIDGYCAENNTYFEFHGCLFHGCPKCNNSNKFNKFKQETMGTTYNRHMKRINEIKAIINGELIEIWECEWDKMFKNDEELKHYLKDVKIRDTINPRDALFGGRTNGVKLHYVCKPNEKIKYIDFTSLYPSVQKYGEYPVGHPDIITENFGNVRDYFGLVYCKVLPPRSLYFPVLPARINKKLVFTLCQTCAINKINFCKHSGNDRAFEGVWVSLEVQEALNQGYEIVETYEVWHWKETAKYDIETKTGGLFTEYVNMFLKSKQEADGFPENANSDEKKKSYIEKYFQREGIILDIDNIEYNKGIRQMSKLLLNSQWGRFGMNTNKTQYKIVSSAAEWFEMASDDQYIIQNVDLSHENLIQVYYTNNKDMHEGNKRTSSSFRNMSCPA